MGITAESIPALLLARIAATPAGVAFMTPGANGTWPSMTWREVGERTRDLSLGLRALGLQDEQRVSILSGTRLEWILADFAVLCAGGATTTVYPSTTPEDTAYILNDSGSVMVFAENDEQVTKLQSRRSEMPNVTKVIVFDGKGTDDGWVIPLAALYEKGRQSGVDGQAEFEKRAKAVRKDALATLVYTSGTTGKPKGVELTHDAWVYEAEGVDALNLILPHHVQYLWLPLSHVFGKVLQMAQVRIGFTTAVDGRVERLVENLAVVKPHFVAAVPRIFEKVYNRVVGNAQESGGAKLAIFRWAISVGRKVSALRQRGRSPGPVLAMQNAIADKLVFSKIKARFGGRLQFFVSGSAPLSSQLAEFFHAADILVLEGYGMTESSAASCVNVPSRYRFGTVGPPLPGTEIRIASDGEILIRGRGVMRGYHNMPELSAEVKDAEGWLKTGDVGVLEDGFLRITDRKKDLFKTSNGKYVAPSALELKLKVACPYIGNVLIHGENRNFVTALVALEPEAVTKWAKTAGLEGKSYQDIVTSPQAKALIEPFVQQVNQTIASYEQVKRFAILPEDLTLENGALTPSLKLKRKVVETRYKDVLDGFYRGGRD